MQVRQIFQGRSLRFGGASAVFAAGLPPRQVATVRVTALPLAAEVLATLRAYAARRRPVDLVLDRALCLTKTIALPHAARRAAPAAIDMQLRQQMPARAAGLIWRSERTGRSGGTQGYRVHIFKQQDLTDLLQAAAATGAEVRRVTIATDAPTAPVYHRRTRADRITRVWHGLAIGLAVLATGAVLALQMRQTAVLNARSAALSAEITQLLDAAAAAKAQLVERDAAMSGLVTDVARFNADYRRFPVIADLTDSLDDGVWISSLSLDGDDMRLAGFSQAALSDTVQKVQAAPWAEEVTIDGPVVVDPVRRENRFQLRVTLRPFEVPS
ncbi:Tfp pilus assembly protein PilN [Loktanella atrilutea]|uniref:Tfp pilus assembly protein PilN n=1 Tax=Loktanella atrilutea TaxID=366533 RepID=A0A1M4UBC7_LOKAT|nr:PilN domain-containing protein [Loktanella atrilutea]SHE54092.1 Tfp pilus assembly protein PilN [Loktanella atrilutea]